jgi:hypothetical protein
MAIRRRAPDPSPTPCLLRLHESAAGRDGRDDDQRRQHPASGRFQDGAREVRHAERQHGARVQVALRVGDHAASLVAA